MRASKEQLRDSTLDAVDAARGHVSELVTAGADLLAASIDQGTSTIGGGIDRVIDSAPTIKFEVTRHRHSWSRRLLVAVVVLVAGVALARLVKARRTSDDSADDEEQ
jgi:hypothetical protein